MRGTTRILCMAAVLATAAASFAADNAPAEETVRPELVHRPQDQAPAELIIVPRPPEEYLPEGSLLAAGAREKRQVDLDELRRRKIEMYAGRLETRTLPSASDAPSAGRPLALELPPAPQANFGVVVFWSLVAACVAASLWLFLRVALALRR
jgi:hypothetical protein